MTPKGEPTYTAVWNGPAVLVTIADCSDVDELRTRDGAFRLRDRATGRLVGFRIDDVNDPVWTYDHMGDEFAITFGWGGAGPLAAAREACPDDTMREKYIAQYGNTPEYFRERFLKRYGWPPGRRDN